MAKRRWIPPADAKPEDRFRAGRLQWSEADDEVLRECYADTLTSDLAKRLRHSNSSTHQRARKLGLSKSKAFIAQTARMHSLRPDHGGRRHQFPKGHVPQNKGLRRPGWHRGRMQETQFKKGVRQGVATKLWKPIGTERLSKDGYLERKVNDGLPLQARWRAVHLIIWESANGPLPKGHAVIFVNGDKTDIRLENLECLTRRQLMARNTVHNLPKPVARAVQLLGALNRQIRKRAHDGQHDQRST